MKDYEGDKLGGEEQESAREDYFIRAAAAAPAGLRVSDADFCEVQSCLFR